MFVYVGMRKGWASKGRKHVYFPKTLSGTSQTLPIATAERKLWRLDSLCVYTDSEAGDHNLIIGIYIVFLMLMHKIAAF